MPNAAVLLANLMFSELQLMQKRRWERRLRPGVRPCGCFVSEANMMGCDIDPCPTHKPIFTSKADFKDVEKALIQVLES